MKKSVAKILNEFAEKLPVFFDVEYEKVPMFGWELMLTPIGDRQKLEKETIYEIEVPVYRAVEHKQQLKDAFKRGGVKEVENYFTTVMQNSGVQNLQIL